MGYVAAVWVVVFALGLLAYIGMGVAKLVGDIRYTFIGESLVTKLTILRWLAIRGIVIVIGVALVAVAYMVFWTWFALLVA